MYKERLSWTCLEFVSESRKTVRGIEPQPHYCLQPQKLQQHPTLLNRKNELAFSSTRNDFII